MFAGKKLHPFFSSWKEDKKNRGVIDAEGKKLAVGRKNKEKTCAPIHVFERSQVSLSQASSYCYYGNFRVAETETAVIVLSSVKTFCNRTLTCPLTGAPGNFLRRSLGEIFVT